MPKVIEKYADSDRNLKTVLNSILKDTSGFYVEKFKTYLTYSSYIAVEKKDFQLSEALDKRYAEVKRRRRIIADDLVFITGKQKATVSRWLSEDYTIPSADVVCALARAFSVTSDFLLGISGTAEQKTEEEYSVFRKYGIAPEAFLNLAEYHDHIYNVKNEAEEIHYERMMEGLNLLLSQKGDAPLSVLMSIGEFIAYRNHDTKYEYDDDDLENLYSALFEAKREKPFDEAFVKEELEFFKSQCPVYSPNRRAMLQLEGIKDMLLEYKKELMPEFFEPYNVDNAE